MVASFLEDHKTKRFFHYKSFTVSDICVEHPPAVTRWPDSFMPLSLAGWRSWYANLSELLHTAICLYLLLNNR